MSGFGDVGSGRFFCGRAMCVMETTYTVGVVAASMPRGGMNSGDVRLGGSSWCAFGFVES
jgi:hypothetical protein